MVPVQDFMPYLSMDSDFMQNLISFMIAVQDFKPRLTFDRDFM